MTDASLLPPNRTALDRAVTQATALDLSPEVIRTLWDAQRCPEPLLPWLAWSVSVDEWDDTWPATTKRALIQDSIVLHRRKGTVWAVKRVLAHLGYPDAEIIEFTPYLQAWQEAGGRTLNGAWSLADGLTLKPPSTAYGNQRLPAINHWAEYALCLNVGDGEWTRSAQRQVRRLMSQYAPARSHLKGLLTRASFGFDSTIRLVDVRLRAHTRLDHCKRLAVHRWRTLDGCWLLDHDYAPSALDGVWRLDGHRHLQGRAPAGVPLDSGLANFAMRGKVRLALRAAGGDRRGSTHLIPARPLHGQQRLSGRYLDGRWRLSGGWQLDYPTLTTLGLRRLDGTWHLGNVPGLDGIWFSAVATVRRGGVSTREVL